MFFHKKNKKNISIEEKNKSSNYEKDWFDNDQEEIEGQLAIDVYQTQEKIFIKSTIAGVEPENLKISLHNDLLTIKGVRSAGFELEEKNYLYQECYWGPFSRSIILPEEVDPQRVEAELENGILTIILYKNIPQKIAIKIKD